VGVEISSARGASDAALIAGSLTRPEAFAAIFDRHFDAIHAYLARRCGAERADDLAAAVFEVAFSRRAAFDRSADSARPWLYGIATNLLRASGRAERRALAALPRLLEPSAGTGELGSGDDDARVDRETLAQALASLDRDQRDVLLLHAWEELTYDQIAQALGIPVGTVRSRLARARSKVRAAIERGATKP
jgi:RNA polymerase sigma factor (sigma-70 family)